MVYTVVQSFELTFPIELGNSYQWNCDYTPGTNNVGGNMPSPCSTKVLLQIRIMVFGSYTSLLFLFYLFICF